jgi:DNA-binding NarL/FixJ family response regulator
MANPGDTPHAPTIREHPVSSLAAIRVLIVDDQRLVRMGHALVLDSADDITVVGEAATGEEAITQAAELSPDVVLMDIRMPGIGGVDATRIITASPSGAHVLVLTTFDLDEYGFGALEAGASGFLLKSATPDQLVAAVRTVASGEAVVEPRITRRLIEHYTGRAPTSTPPNTATRPPELGELSPREYDIFLAIAAGRSNPEICADLHLSPATVKTHINRIFSKLGLRDRVQAVILAYTLRVTERP